MKRGAEARRMPIGPMELDIPCIEGIGGAYIYLVDRYGAQSIYDVDFKPIEGADEAKNSVGLTYLDHLTHNVFRGNMANVGGLLRAHLQLPRDPLFRHRRQSHGPVLKGDDQPMRQDPHSAERVEGRSRQGRSDRRISAALSKARASSTWRSASDNLYAVVDRLRARGVELQDTIETYFDLIDKRLPGHGEPRRGTAQAPHPDRRRAERRAGPAAADLLARTRSGRSSSSSFSARAMKASAKAISKPCSSRSNSTRSAAAC